MLREACVVILVFVLVLLNTACSNEMNLSTVGDEDNYGHVSSSNQISAVSSDDVRGALAGMIGCDSMQTRDESFPIQSIFRTLLDVLIVIDGSPDMAQQRKMVAKRLQPLLERIAASDYQVAIISSDLGACVDTIITKSTPNAIETLTEAVATGPATSRGDFATMKVITGLTNVKDAVWKGHVINKSTCSDDSWLRDGSIVATIVISNKKHLCCHIHACTMPDIEAALRSTGRIGSSSSQRKLYRLYGLLNQKMEYTRQSSEYGAGIESWYVDWRDFEQYQVSGTNNRLVDFVKSIDTPNYDDIFNSITDDIVTSLGDTFTLAEKHDDACAQVALTSDGIAQVLDKSEFSITGKTLKIKRVLSTDDTQVDITYTY